VSEYALSKILKSPELGGIVKKQGLSPLEVTYNSGKVHFDDAENSHRQWVLKLLNNGEWVH